MQNVQGFYAQYQDGAETRYEGFVGNLAFFGQRATEGVLEEQRIAAVLFLRLTAVAREREACTMVAQQAGSAAIARKIRARQPDPLAAIDPGFREQFEAYRPTYPPT